ncbi:DUF1905 domain-containing protein [Agromyces endophyticus]|uniref:DUF1905 domain-containing protein n=1 Tax=Agromyces sp. H17E-10 TaxID=2932244 RepID=UPI001FD602A8|nr:DUF1905 domain-containing protein [Agromyces sp. H17E-10]UOQ88079.1 DUF1905 domain-containing protein [Agromyces sp. H17E-10]
MRAPEPPPGLLVVFSAEIYEWASRRNWFFVDVPPEPSADIADRPRMPRGFGSAPVTVTVGETTWRTSIFPSGDTYALPLKRAVLDAEAIGEGDVIEVRLVVHDD